MKNFLIALLLLGAVPAMAQNADYSYSFNIDLINSDNDSSGSGTGDSLRTTTQCWFRLIEKEK